MRSVISDGDHRSCAAVTKAAEFAAIFTPAMIEFHNGFHASCFATTASLSVGLGCYSAMRQRQEVNR